MPRVFRDKIAPLFLPLNVNTSAPIAPFHWQVRVYYEDTDSGGVVYYANYLRFMERARTEWLRQLGFEQDMLAAGNEGIVFAVRSVDVEFIRPARLDDLLTVTAQPAEIRSASLKFNQAIYRHPVDGPAELLAQGGVRIACLGSGSFSPTPIPRFIRQVLNSASRS